VSKIDADEVLQLYITLPDNAFERPNYSLKGIKKINLKAGESQNVTFTITAKEYTGFEENGQNIIYKGAYTLYIGGACPSNQSIKLGAPTPLKGNFWVK
jgi:beta-glucosidase